MVLAFVSADGEVWFVCGCRYPVQPPVDIDERNAYFHEEAIKESIEFRLNHSVHKAVNEESTLNTLR